MDIARKSIRCQNPRPIATIYTIISPRKKIYSYSPNHTKSPGSYGLAKGQCQPDIQRRSAFVEHVGCHDVCEHTLGTLHMLDKSLADQPCTTTAFGIVDVDVDLDRDLDVDLDSRSRYRFR